MSRQYVVIKDCAAGNDSVGTEWQETKIFAATATLDEVMAWAMGGARYRDMSHSRDRITLTKPHQSPEGM